mgnify:CR=1 FL=1
MKIGRRETGQRRVPAPPDRITGTGRGGRITKLKTNTDQAMLHVTHDCKCLIVKRTGGQTTWIDGRDYDYNEMALEADEISAPIEVALMVAAWDACDSRWRPETEMRNTARMIVSTPRSSPIAMNRSNSDSPVITSGITNGA